MFHLCCPVKFYNNLRDSTIIILILHMINLKHKELGILLKG